MVRVVPCAVVPIPEIHVDRQGHEKGLVRRIAHVAKIDCVVVDVGRQEPGEQARELLADVPDLLPTPPVIDIEIDLRTRPDWARHPEAWLAAPAICREDLRAI